MFAIVMRSHPQCSMRYRKSQCTFIISAGDRIPRVGCVIALIDNASVL
ncbi:MAG: hypothetical protein V7L22_31095 [Nostoc sp.]